MNFFSGVWFGVEFDFIQSGITLTFLVVWCGVEFDLISHYAHSRCVAVMSRAWFTSLEWLCSRVFLAPDNR